MNIISYEPLSDVMLAAMGQRGAGAGRGLHAQDGGMPAAVIALMMARSGVTALNGSANTMFNVSRDVWDFVPRMDVSGSGMDGFFAAAASPAPYRERLRRGQVVCTTPAGLPERVLHQSFSGRTSWGIAGVHPDNAGHKQGGGTPRTPQVASRRAVAHAAHGPQTPHESFYPVVTGEEGGVPVAVAFAAQAVRPGLSRSEPDGSHPLERLRRGQVVCTTPSGLPRQRGYAPAPRFRSESVGLWPTLRTGHRLRMDAFNPFVTGEDGGVPVMECSTAPARAMPRGMAEGMAAGAALFHAFAAPEVLSEKGGLTACAVPPAPAPAASPERYTACVTQAVRPGPHRASLAEQESSRNIWDFAPQTDVFGDGMDKFFAAAVSLAPSRAFPAPETSSESDSFSLFRPDFAVSRRESVAIDSCRTGSAASAGSSLFSPDFAVSRAFAAQEVRPALSQAEGDGFEPRFTRGEETSPIASGPTGGRPRATCDFDEIWAKIEAKMNVEMQRQ